MTNYNKTQLNPDTTFERHVYHRDVFAHYLRWTHVLKRVQIGMNILDFGCGSGNLCEVLYRNRFKPSVYVGFDIRERTIEKCKSKYSQLGWAKFSTVDLCDPVYHKATQIPWNIICCFEVIEHCGKENAVQLLKNVLTEMDDNTILLLSTPCYSEGPGAADNHIIEGEIGEFGYEELKEILSSLFSIESVYGTFASQRDYKPHMNEWQRQYYEAVKDYFDVNILSNLMAPLFPEYSRNCMWELKRRT